MKLGLNPVMPEDEFLWQMLVYAAHETSLKAVKTHPILLKYVAGWGKVGDTGIVAMLDQHPLGAAWLRLWDGETKGYGYFDDATPELATGVLPEYRGQGIGTQLLKQIIVVARGNFPAISLSVRPDNPAVNLYQRFGFVESKSRRHLNRVGGYSLTVYRF
ncbi:GNAT family N-acetyltransferase [Moorena producens JHB]|uniref:GNAT family N-acetyltransferase n=1 Tax=Moorena producens (strain JHB) TaxID=1454205 RepID=A0A1D9G985_MOOP1|nr:GNAT family N-acetyltransferase [Moorena producens]AOY84192.1 GNAT family N-acetyltransferase [Moorena producens JHB]